MGHPDLRSYFRKSDTRYGLISHVKTFPTIAGSAAAIARASASSEASKTARPIEASSQGPARISFPSARSCFKFRKWSPMTRSSSGVASSAKVGRGGR